MRDRALFDLAIDSKLRGCDLVKIKIGTLVAGPAIRYRSMVIQQKTGRPVQFEITADTRASLLAWLERRGGTISKQGRSEWSPERPPICQARRRVGYSYRSNAAGVWHAFIAPN